MNANNFIPSEENLTLLHSCIKSARARSSWAKGVKLYALELLDNYDNLVRFCARMGYELAPLNRENLLDGAKDWVQYSQGGCALVYNWDIAERLCSPSELKRCTRKGGTLRELDWLKIQARALAQAASLLFEAAAKFAAKADNGNAPFEMQCKPGDTSVMFTAAAAAGEQSSYTAELAAPAGVDLLCRFSSKLFTAAATGWNGGMWFSRANGPAILDCAGAVCTLIMPMIVEGARMDCAEEAVIPALERFNHLPEGVALPAQKKATRRKKTASTAAPANSVEAAPAPAPTVTPEEVTAATDTYAESYAAWLTGDAQSDITPEESEAAITAQYKALSALIEQYHIERKEAPENAAIEARRYITKLHEDVAAADRARRARITEQCNRARAFVDWFVGAVDTVAGVMLRAALNAAVERVKELAALAGVPLVDVLADAVPVPPPTPEHSDGGESQPEAEAVEVSEAESAAAPVEADLQPSEVAACAVGVPPSEAAAPIAATMEAYGAPAVAGGRYATIAATGGNTTPRAGKLARKHTHRIRDGTTVEASQSSPLNYNPSFIM